MIMAEITIGTTENLAIPEAWEKWYRWGHIMGYLNLKSPLWFIYQMEPEVKVFVHKAGMSLKQTYG
jgi:hypothetical protein